MILQDMLDPIQKSFKKIGVGVNFFHPSWSISGWGRAPSIRQAPIDWPQINVRKFTRPSPGEIFDINLAENVHLAVRDTDAAAKHLLLEAERPDGTSAKWLCGHDERHWFVAAVPETTDPWRSHQVHDVRSAMLALQPREVKEAARKADLTIEQQLRRKNKAFIRQGEWFFVPEEPSSVAIMQTKKLVNEPLSRGRGSKPHYCQEVYREGGTAVMVHSIFAQFGLEPGEFNKLSFEQASAEGWRQGYRDGRVWAKGNVSHPDHSTVTLKGWHRVHMNEEAKARHAPQMVFLD